MSWTGPLNRRLLRVPLACLLVAMAASGCSPPDAEPVPPMIQDGPSESVKAWARAVEAGDLDAIADMHLPHTVSYTLGSMQIKGARDITAAYAEMFADAKASVVIKDAHYLATPDVVHSWGLFELTLTPTKGGEPTVLKGRFSDIAMQQQGKWRYILDHASLPAESEKPPG